MDFKPKRIKGIEYPSSLSIVLKDREYIADVEGYYRLLGFDPNEKNWGKHEIKSKFRKLVKRQGHNKKLIEAHRVLTGVERVLYDSLTLTIERLIEEISSNRKEIKKQVEYRDTIPTYTYYVDEGSEENYELAMEWMRIASLFNHRAGIEESVRIVLSKQFKKNKYSWGNLIYVNTKYAPSLDALAYNLLKNTKDNWYIDYCKIVRN